MGQRERKRQGERLKMIIISLWILQPINFYVSQKVTRGKFMATTPCSCAQHTLMYMQREERFQVDIIDTYFGCFSLSVGVLFPIISALRNANGWDVYFFGLFIYTLTGGGGSL
jgi:hypothetical protein